MSVEAGVGAQPAEAAPPGTPGAADPGARGLGLVPAPVLMLIGMVSTQLGAAFAKQMFGTVGPAVMTVLRLGFAAAALLLWWRPSFRLERRTALAVAGLGITIAGMNMCFYLAMARLPVGVALTIGMSGPLMVAALSSRRGRDRMWTLLAGAGIALLGWQGGATGLAGLLISAACAVFWGAYVPLSARVGAQLPGGGGLALAMLFGTLCALPFGLAEGGSVLGHPWALAFGFGVAMLSSLVPYTCEMETLRRVPALVFGVLLSLEPAIGALVALIVLGETLSAGQVLGLASVVVASIGVIRGTRATT
ncbi:EamA family transporter [Streptomyces dangxiongensis]|uniref:EamA family transporter n=1 Tax=Streptomyces dangxiongensis TaxID=1442032 RepID=A0A3G2JEU3_9ACTN|nr:EamA family transporter [Streptomyces dangxiongensis]AYN39042.1 EamA family transporter [Streptomyces dangxiongensis]